MKRQQQVHLPPSHTHQTRPRMEPEDENNTMSTAAQEHLPPEPITERPIDRLIKAVSEEVILDDSSLVSPSYL